MTNNEQVLKVTNDEQVLKVTNDNLVLRLTNDEAAALHSYCTCTCCIGLMQMIIEVLK